MSALWNFWRTRKAFVLEGFLVLNFAVLAVDILLAHAVNSFAHKTEWIPFVFSIVATLVLGPVFLWSWVKKDMNKGRSVVILFGVASVLVGIAGMGFHLQSQFLRVQSIKHLVYTAPFVAPLAYSGVGSLLIFNRAYARDSGWAFGVAFGALGGYFGNFVLALCDHAQNGFFHPAEWLAVGASALATGFVAAAILVGSGSRTFLYWLLGVLAVQGSVGAAGFALHARANLDGQVESVVDRFIHGAPTFAPLLLINISVLAVFAWIDWFGAQSSVRSKFAE